MIYLKNITEKKNLVIIIIFTVERFFYVYQCLIFTWYIIPAVRVFSVIPEATILTKYSLFFIKIFKTMGIMSIIPL